jgi:hypothetical protein
MEEGGRERKAGGRSSAGGAAGKQVHVHVMMSITCIVHHHVCCIVHRARAAHAADTGSGPGEAKETERNRPSRKKKRNRPREAKETERKRLLKGWMTACAGRDEQDVLQHVVQKHVKGMLACRARGTRHARQRHAVPDVSLKGWRHAA